VASRVVVPRSAFVALLGRVAARTGSIAGLLRSVAACADLLLAPQRRLTELLLLLLLLRLAPLLLPARLKVQPLQLPCHAAARGA